MPDFTLHPITPDRPSELPALSVIACTAIAALVSGLAAFVGSLL